MLDCVSIPENRPPPYPARMTIMRASGQALDPRLIDSPAPAQWIETSDPGLVRELGRRGSRRVGLRFTVLPGGMGEVHRQRSLLISHGATLVLRDSDTAPGRAVQFLASLNLPVEVDAQCLSGMSVEKMLDLGDRLLCSPFVKTPVQPFAALLSSLAAGDPPGGATLWDLSGERIGRHLFVAGDGAVALSPRWHAAGVVFGRCPDPLESLRESAPWRRMELAYSSFPASYPTCACCPAGRFCAGFFRAVDPAAECASFVALHAFLQSRVESIRDAFRRLSPPDQNTVVRSVVSSVSRGRPSRVGRPRPPPAAAAVVFVADRCANRCVFCAPADKRREQGGVDGEQVLRFLGECAREGVASVSFSGAGEPLLNPELPGLVRFAKQAGVRRTFITTSGAGLTAAKIRELETAGNDGITLSVHGVGPVHDAAVGRVGAFEELRRTIDLLRRSSTVVCVNTCLLRGNLNQIGELLDLGRSIPCREHTLSFPEWAGSALVNETLLASYAEVREALAAVDWAGCRDVVLDNLPPCMAPDGVRLSRPEPVVRYLEFNIGGRAPAARNFGRNKIPPACREARCPSARSCVGVDGAYLRARGAGEFPPDGPLAHQAASRVELGAAS